MHWSSKNHESRVVVGAQNRTYSIPIKCSESIPESIPMLESILLPESIPEPIRESIREPIPEPILELTPEPNLRRRNNKIIEVSDANSMIINWLQINFDS